MFSDSEEHSPSELYYPGETNDKNASFFTIEEFHRAGTTTSTDVSIDEAEQNNNSQEMIDEFINAQKAKNTVTKTKSDVKTFKSYLLSINVAEEEIERLPAEQFDHYLAKFFMNVRKQDAGEYEPNTLSSIQRSIQRHLNDQKSKVNILKDPEFEKSRKVLAAKRKNLVNIGKGNKPQATRALTDDEEDALFLAGEFGDSSPESLQKTMWWFLSMHFGFRARDESRKLCWGDVQLQSDPQDGREMLVWVAERGTKTRTGKEQGHQRAFQPKLYATNTPRCPVQFYKMFRSHRPATMNVPDAPFYVAIKNNRRANDGVWYKNAPLGKNMIGNFMRNAAGKAKLQQGIGAKISNHSVRKTSISRLLDADIPENFVAQLSGHKSIDSLQSYKSASHHHQRRMSLTLSRNQQQTSQSISNQQSTSTVMKPSSRPLQPLSLSQNHSETASVTSSFLATTSSATASTSLVRQAQLPNQIAAIQPMVEAPLFAGSNVQTVSGCSFQIYRGPVTIVQERQETKPPKRRRIVIDSDDDDEQ